MDRKYSEITDSLLSRCYSERESWLVMKQIAYNLASIADELAEANRINSQTIGDICRTIDMSGIGLPPQEE